MSAFYFVGDVFQGMDHEFVNSSSSKAIQQFSEIFLELCVLRKHVEKKLFISIEYRICDKNHKMACISSTKYLIKWHIFRIPKI